MRASRFGWEAMFWRGCEVEENLEDGNLGVIRFCVRVGGRLVGFHKL